MRAVYNCFRGKNLYPTRRRERKMNRGCRHAGVVFGMLFAFRQIKRFLYISFCSSGFRFAKTCAPVEVLLPPLAYKKTRNASVSFCWRAIGGNSHNSFNLFVFRQIKRFPNIIPCSSGFRFAKTCAPVEVLLSPLAYKKTRNTYGVFRRELRKLLVLYGIHHRDVAKRT